MDHSGFDTIRRFILTLGLDDLKAVILLVRYGISPTPLDTDLLSRIPLSLASILYSNWPHLQVSTIGQIFFEISGNPIISSSLISMALSVIPDDNTISQAFVDSLSKEVLIMESCPRPASINWSVYFAPIAGQCFPLPHQRFEHSPQVLEIHSAFRRFRNQVRFSRIWPYATTRGIARSTRNSFYSLRQQNKISLVNTSKVPCSLDVIRHYVHFNQLPSGPCEIKQRWYPSQLKPRTYFAQGGDAIRVSTYLRTFFNDFTDTFLPTERFARVDGSRLKCPPNGFFFIYDLTSFTSNYHEQQSLLRSMADFFRETIVFLVGPALSLKEASIGDLIDEYCDIVNVLPEYEFSKELIDVGLDHIRLVHRVAGFLGVPGNLAICTIGHGITVGTSLASTEFQSTAGDDGNVGILKDQETEICQTIALQGIFQREKGSSTEHTPNASYLKRPFRQVDNRGVMIERVDFPLLGSLNCIVSVDPRFPKLSQDKSRLRRSFAASTAKLFRDIFRLSGGVLDSQVKQYILDFLQEIYSKAELPTHGMVRKMYGSDHDRVTRKVDAAVVFPLDIRYLERDPDILICEEFLPWHLEVPVETDNVVRFREGESWRENEEYFGRSSKALEQLVRLGFVEKAETERVVMYGEDARRYFRRLMREDFLRQEFCFRAISTLSSYQLSSIGLSGLSDSELKQHLGNYDRKSNRMTFRRKYEDLDRQSFLPSDFPTLGDMY